MITATTRVAILERGSGPPMTLTVRLQEEGYAVKRCQTATEVEHLAKRREVDLAIVIPPTDDAQASDAERAEVARLCLTLPTVVAPWRDVELVLSALSSRTTELDEQRPKLLHSTQVRLEKARPTGPGPMLSHEGRLLQTLERLLALDALDLDTAMQRGADAIADVLSADKTDIFVVDTSGRYLVAIGTSATPMGRKQHALGLDRLPVADGGRVAEVFRTGRAYRHNDVGQDAGELKSVARDLGVRSNLMAPLQVGDERRGVLLASSATPGFFAARDQIFLVAVGRWIGLIGKMSTEAEQLATRRVVQDGIRARHTESVELLTPRQREIAGLVAEGLSNAEIAERLVLAPGTVANHVAEILQRLNFRRRTQIATWAIGGTMVAPGDR